MALTEESSASLRRSVSTLSASRMTPSMSSTAIRLPRAWKEEPVSPSSERIADRTIKPKRRAAMVKEPPMMAIQNQGERRLGGCMA